LDARNRVRRENMLALSERNKHLPGLTITVEYPGATHIYYGYKVIYDSGVLGIPSHELVRLLRPEGVQIKVSDSKPLHQEPLFNEQYDRTVLGWPFTEEWYRRMVDCRKLRLSCYRSHLYKKGRIGLSRSTPSLLKRSGNGR